MPTRRTSNKYKLRVETIYRTMYQSSIIPVPKTLRLNPLKPSTTMAPKRGRKAGRDMLERLAKAVTHEVADEAVSKHCVLKVIDSLAAIGWGELATIGRFNLPGLLRMTVPPLR